MNKLIKADIKKIMYSPTTIAAVIGIAFCICLDTWNQIPFLWNSNKGNITVFYYLFNSYAFGGNYMPFAALLLAALPATSLFCMEYESGVQPYIIQRVGSVRIYAVVRIIITIIGSSYVTFMGMLLFVTTSAFFQPLYSRSFDMETNILPFFELLCKARGIPYFCMMAFLASLRASLFNVASLLLSAKVRNRYAVTAAPLLFAFAFTRLMVLVNLPMDARPDLWFMCRTTLFSEKTTVIACLIIWICVVITCGFFFVKKVEENEK